MCLSGIEVFVIEEDHISVIKMNYLNWNNNKKTIYFR